MNILTIDDRLKFKGYFKQNINKDIEEEVTLSKGRLLYETAQDVKKNTTNGEWIIFINLFLDCKDEEFNCQQDQAGIALLKFLRMMGVNHHVVLVTPYIFEELMKQGPGNYIITSEGVSLTSEHKRFIIDFNNCYDEDMLVKLSEKSFTGDLKKYLKPGFSLPEDERHNWANWWGVVQLCDVHRGIFNDEVELGSSSSLNYPEIVNDKIKSLRNLQALKLYQKGARLDTTVEEQVLELKRKEIENDLQEWKSEKQDLEDQLKRFNRAIKTFRAKTEHHDDEFYSTEADYLDDFYGASRYHQNELKDEIKQRKRLIKQYEIDIAAKEKELKNLSRTIKNADVQREQIDELRFKKNKHKPKILYIDDQAEEGWSEIFQILIYGKKDTDHFQTPDKLDYDSIKKKIENGTLPDLILLDLRLENEAGTNLNVDEISGAIILKRIREDFPGLPIMMTTASNKAWSYEALFELGLDCYWTKEGLDVSASLSEKERTDYSVKNYLKFLRYTNVLFSEEYQFLNRIGAEIKDFINKKGTEWWWKDHIWEWNENGNEKVSHTHHRFSEKRFTDEIYEITYNIIPQYREHIKKLFNTSSKKLDKFEAARIINHLGQLIELIHIGTDETKNTDIIGYSYDVEDNYITYYREDYIAWCLYMFRNKSSRYGTSRRCKERYLQSFIAGLLTWIKNENLPTIDKSHLNITLAKGATYYLRCWNKRENSKDAASFLARLTATADSGSKRKYRSLMYG